MRVNRQGEVCLTGSAEGDPFAGGMGVPPKRSGVDG